MEPPSETIISLILFGKAAVCNNCSTVDSKTFSSLKVGIMTERVGWTKEDNSIPQN